MTRDQLDSVNTAGILVRDLHPLRPGQYETVWSGSIHRDTSAQPREEPRPLPDLREMNPYRERRRQQNSYGSIMPKVLEAFRGGRASVDDLIARTGLSRKQVFSAVHALRADERLKTIVPGSRRQIAIYAPIDWQPKEDEAA